VIGALEIAGAVGVLVPRFSGLAALGLVCLMAGATLTNVLVLGASPLFPLVLLAVGVLVAWGRWPRSSPGPSCVVAVAIHAQTLEGRNEKWLTTR